MTTSYHADVKIGKSASGCGAFFGGQRAAGDFLPVTDVDFVRAVRVVEAAEIHEVFLQPTDFLLRRQFAGMIRPGSASPKNA